MENSMAVLLIIKNRLAIRPSNPSPCLPEKLQKHLFKKMYVPLCFLQHYSHWPRHGNNQRVLWINKTWNTYTMEYYIAVRKVKSEDKIMLFVTTLMDI